MLRPQGPITGGAWLSSARVVRCWVKSRNERNPCSMLPAGKAGDSGETAGDKPEEGGILGVAVKCVDIKKNTCGEGGFLV